MDILETLKTLWESSGFHSFLIDGGWKNLIMIAVACLLLYLGIKKKFGKNAILKGTSLEERSTAKMRNKLIGGHNGGEDE